MSLRRNVILSMHNYLSDQLTAGGWSDVTWVLGQWPEERRIVLPGDSLSGEAGVVTLPAIKLESMGVRPGDRMGVGESKEWYTLGMHTFHYAITEGQDEDLREFLSQALAHKRVDLYDYDSTGYPSASATTTSYIDIENVTDTRAYMIGAVHAALRFGGEVAFQAVTLRTLS